MPERAASDEAPKPPVASDAAIHAGPPAEIRDVLLRLQSPPLNPVTRARNWVEMEIPESQRGPGWDRHWRELEAYAESAAIWTASSE